MSEGNAPRKGGLQRLDTLRNTLGREKPRGRQQQTQAESPDEDIERKQDEQRDKAKEPSPQETRESGGEVQDRKRDESSLEQGQTRSRSDGENKRSRTTRRRKAKPREGVTRVTVDLPDDQYSFLRTFVARSGSDGMSVVRATLTELQQDQALAERVVQRLVEERIKAASR